MTRPSSRPASSVWPKPRDGLRVKARQLQAADFVPVILHPGVVERLVSGQSSAPPRRLDDRSRRGAISTRPVRRTRTAVLREDLTLRLDPLQPLKSGSYRVSVEGVPAAPLHRSSNNGRLVQPVLDLKYARRLGSTCRPTPLPYASDALRFEGPKPLSLIASALGRGGGGCPDPLRARVAHAGSEQRGFLTRRSAGAGHRGWRLRGRYACDPLGQRLRCAVQRFAASGALRG